MTQDSAESPDSDTLGRLQVIDGGKVAGSIPPFAQRPIRTAKDARRMLARLIHGFQCGGIEGTDAKTLCYLLVSYAQLVKDTEFEERLKELEVKIGGKR